MNIWIAEAVSPYHSITGVFRSLGAAVRAAKREAPDAEWDRIGHMSLCGGGGYSLSGKRRVLPWQSCDHRGLEYVYFRFTRRRLKQSLSGDMEGGK